MYEAFSGPTSGHGDARVKYVLLYRGAREWRTTVGTADELACGALSGTEVDAAFDLAAEEFAVVLRDYWGVDEPIEWKRIKPNWWGADLVPGSLAAAGKAP